MNKKFEQVLNDISSAVNEGIAIAGHAYDGIMKDIQELVALSEARLRDLIDRVVADETIRNMAREFFSNINKGKDAAVAALKREYARCQGKLDEIVDEKKEVVGFWDGFVSIFLATPAARRPRSRIYVTHVRYGKVIGVASAVFLFFPAGRIGALIASLPIVVRGAEYLKTKVMAARESVAGTP